VVDTVTTDMMGPARVDICRPAGRVCIGYVDRPVASEDRYELSSKSYCIVLYCIEGRQTWDVMRDVMLCYVFIVGWHCFVLRQFHCCGAVKEDFENLVGPEEAKRTCGENYMSDEVKVIGWLVTFQNWLVADGVVIYSYTHRISSYCLFYYYL